MEQSEFDTPYLADDYDVVVLISRLLHFAHSDHQSSSLDRSVKAQLTQVIKGRKSFNIDGTEYSQDDLLDLIFSDKD